MSPTRWEEPEDWGHEDCEVCEEARRAYPQPGMYASWGELAAHTLMVLAVLLLGGAVLLVLGLGAWKILDGFVAALVGF